MMSKIFDTIRESLLLLDSSLIVSAASRNFYSKFLVSAEETIGRPLHHLGKGQWNIPELTNLIHNIFTTNRSIEDYQVEHTFPLIGHKIMLLNARKIFDEKDSIHKVLLSIEDITKKEILAREKLYHSELNKSIIDTIKDPLLVLDENLMVIESSRNYNNIFSVDREEVVGRFFYDLGHGQWNISELRELISDIMISNTAIESYQIEHTFPVIGYKVMLLNIRKIHHNIEINNRILISIEDITDNEILKRENSYQNTLNKHMIDTVRNPLLLLDDKLNILEANRNFYSHFLVSREKTIGFALHELGNGQWNIQSLYKLLYELSIKDNMIINYQIEHNFPQLGRRIMLLNASMVIADHSHNFKRILLSIEDVTERILIERKLEKQRLYNRAIIETVKDPIIILDSNLKVLDASKSFFNVFMVDSEITIGHHLYELGDGQWDIPELRTLLKEVLSNHNTIEEYEVEHEFDNIGHKTMMLNARELIINQSFESSILLSIKESTIENSSSWKDENEPSVLVGIEDITENKMLTEKLQQLATHDPLTGLANRNRFLEKMDEFLDLSSRTGLSLGLLALDLDNFKPVNDELGHHVGDHVLKEVSKRLKDTVREVDEVSRLGGDEFMISAIQIESEYEAIYLCNRILEAIAAPIIFENNTIKIGASIGISLSPHHSTNRDELMRMADEALYISKNKGRNCYTLYKV